MRDAAQECVAVGFFDGVHLGHQAILCGATTAITFRNHPLGVLAPDRAPRLIMTFETRMAAIRACGVHDVVVLDFTEELSRETPERFLSRLGQRVRCGENAHFGAKGVGDAAFLRAHGVDVTVVPYATYQGEIVSSTRIRKALESGRIVDANAMLGHPFAVEGAVFHGKGEGTKIGYPTVNLKLDMQVRLPCGVYVVEVAGRRAIANYGVAPTMGDRAWPEPCLEIHFLSSPSASSNLLLYACCPSSPAVHVAFVDFIRPEMKFESEAALARQIAMDIAACNR